MPRKKGTAVLPLSPEELQKDYRLAYQSRQASLIGRREVLSGKAKFGIFGDGKELAQLAIARAFRKGDWRCGYYRDQTWMFALGVASIPEFFAQLYAHADVVYEPATAGRAMDAHFASRYINPDGTWRSQTEMFNVGSDISPTAAHVPRSVGLAYASCLYRELDSLEDMTRFSHRGDEVTWVTIGNASTAEGLFWESVNAIGVLKAPAIISIYDDGYGISVPNEMQMVKGNISAILEGFRRDPSAQGVCAGGYDLYSVRGWDYPALLETYRRAAETARADHVPALVHVTELTRPQGHSTSGSHERYKPPGRLKWEEQHDALQKMRDWLLDCEVAAAEELARWEEQDYQAVEDMRKRAWEAFTAPILKERQQVMEMLDEVATTSRRAEALHDIRDRLASVPNPARRDIHAHVHQALLLLREESDPAKQVLSSWKKEQDAVNDVRYSSHLYSESSDSGLNVAEIKPVYSDRSPTLMGFEVVNAAFDAAFARDPRIFAFGEDLGKLGDVNQGFRGMQEKYGERRVADTGIREATIIGQAIGMSMRGLRPICEIQYLDYLLYALQLLSDDVATLHWRTAGGQKAPVIVRTRGHRLEGIWHSGSLMAGIIDLVRGMYLLVPRDMTRAAGFYNTLLKSDDPAILIEVLNGYRLKERLPDNIGGFTVPLGVPEVLRAGEDLTLVTYGACCRIALDAADRLAKVGVGVEVIDVQSLLPFDIAGRIGESLRKTNRILFVDEDVSGGATAYMLQQVIEKQGGFAWLDSPPRTLPAKPHRPAYGSDGDYWSKPNGETIFDAVYGIMHEVSPSKFPEIY